MGGVNLDDVVVVALGSNLPGKFASSEDLLEAALRRLAAAGLRILAVSPWWRSQAWPDPREPDYLNGVALVEPSLEPHAAIRLLLATEQEFGRLRQGANAARTLDLDLIAHGRRALDEPGLRVPHPRAHQRRFVMGPLAQIAPLWIHPELGRTAQALAGEAQVGSDARPV